MSPDFRGLNLSAGADNPLAAPDNRARLQGNAPGLRVAQDTRMTQRLLLPALLLLSCGQALRGGPVYVGTVEGTDALVSVVTDGNSVIGYVCGKESWESHTGWFLTQLDDNADSFGTITAADSASGHHLEGTVTEDQASGTIHFADGSTHHFTAETADPKVGAGVFENHTSEGRAGLIITNDGKSAGTANVNTGLNTTSLQVTLNSSTSAGVNVSIGGVDASSSLTTLPPLNPTQVLVTPIGPTLFIVVHGMSDPINTPASAIDTPSYSREEWSLDYFQGLLGGADTDGGTQLPMFNFHGQNITNHYSDATFLPKFDANTVESAIAGTSQLAAHFLTLQNPGGDVATQSLTPPQLSAFITYRDSTGGLVESGQRIANQTYLAIRYYELHFHRTPKVVFVTQSFGGPTVRFVLSNPPQTSLDAPGSPGLNQDHIVLSAEDHRRMDYVRDRIVYTVTQAGPHEGSYMADFAAPLQADITAVAKAVDQGTAGLPVELQATGTFYNLFVTLLLAVPGALDDFISAQGAVHEGMADVEGFVNDRALRDLTHAYWARANVSLLHPKLARRTSASPILHAASQLVPIYTMGGRSPGGRAFTAPEMADFQRFSLESPKEQGWIIGTMATDLLLHARYPQGFGRADVGIYAPFQQKLDRRKRLVDAAAFSRGVINSVVDKIDPWVGEKFGAGVEGALSEQLGLSERVATPIWLDQNGHFDLGGSVQVPALAFQCTNDDGAVLRVVLDFGRLVTAMVNTYGSLTAAMTKLANLDLNGALQALALASTDTSDITGWFVQRYSTFALTTGRCQLPGASVTSLLSIGNLANWHITQGIDTFPAPRWVREGTPVSDGEIDDDGVVTYDSAMGFSLGTQTAIFFDHTRTDFTDDTGAPAPGSWYRFFDSAVEIENHGMPRQYSTGHFIFATVEQPGAGPKPGPGALSTY
jgi:hypothetical protein